MSAQIEKLELRDAPEGLLRSYYDLWVLYEDTFVPGDPIPPFEWFLADWTYPQDIWETNPWIAVEDGLVVGTAGAWAEKRHNLENADGWIYVHPDHRGRGLGHRLAEPLFEWLTENGRIRMSFRIAEGSPYGEIAEKVGAKPALRMRRSRLPVTRVDRDLMELWIERARERSRGYQLLYLPTPIPEQYLEPMSKVQDVMNEAPFEDYVHEDEHTTPEMWRTMEGALAARKDELLSYVAVHEASGEFVGQTNLAYQHLFPEQAWVWNTGVHPAHRDKGLGRWLKAAMMLRVLDDYSAVQRMDTFNAGSNEAMLNINVAMGFEPLVVVVNWQGETATMRERLGL